MKDNSKPVCLLLLLLLIVGLLATGGKKASGVVQEDNDAETDASDNENKGKAAEDKAKGG